MKIGDKIFIIAMVLILCGSGILGLHEFGKNRNLNGINVVGEAKGNIKADDMTIYLQVIATGKDSAQREEILNKRLSIFKETFSGNVIDGNNWCQPETYESEDCWFKNSMIVGGWCKRGGICLHFTGEIEDTIEYVKNSLSGYDNYTNTNRTLTANNNGNSANEMKRLANQNAHEKAESIANSLGVKLGKLLVYSENGFNGGINYYNGDQIILRNGTNIPNSFDIPYTATVYHTYAIK